MSISLWSNNFRKGLWFWKIWNHISTSIRFRKKNSTNHALTSIILKKCTIFPKGIWYSQSYISLVNLWYFKKEGYRKYRRNHFIILSRVVTFFKLTLKINLTSILIILQNFVKLACHKIVIPELIWLAQFENCHAQRAKI